MLQHILNAPRHIKRLITLCYDTIIIPLAIYASLALRHGEVLININEKLVLTAISTTILSLLVFIRAGLYRAVIRYMATKAFGTLAIGITISAMILATSSFITQANLPRSSIIIYWFTAFALLGAPRLLIRNIVNQLSNSSKEAVVIYGAGNQGIALMNALSNSETYLPIAFIDDNRKKQGSIIKGLKVHGQEQLATLNESHNLSLIHISEPTRPY